MSLSPSTTIAGQRSSATWLIWLLVAVGWIMLFAETLPIREANLDDVNFQRLTTTGRMRDYVATWRHAQGRYYGAVALAPIWLLDSIDSPWLFQAARLGLVAAALWALGKLAGEVTGSAELTRLWWLLWIGCLQIPPTFYGLLSYPQLQCGLILVLLAALVFWHHLEANARGGATAWGAGLLFFAGLQFNESFLAFTLLFPALLWWRRRGRPQPAWIGPLAPMAFATATYLVIYLSYRLAHPAVAYEGTRGGFSPGSALLYVIRYSASSLPGFELLIDRNPAHPALATSAEIGHRLATLEMWRIPWAVAIGASSAWLLGRTERWALSRRESTFVALGFAAIGLLFLSLPAVSDKYQGFAHRRFYPHAYNFIFVSCLWLAAAIASLGLATSTPLNSPARRNLALALGLLFGFACLVAQITNPLALAEIKATVSAAN